MSDMDRFFTRVLRRKIRAIGCRWLYEQLRHNDSRPIALPVLWWIAKGPQVMDCGLGYLVLAV